MATATITTEKHVEKKGEVAKVGNLTREPELRFTPSGTAVVSTGLAVERPKVAGDWAGERVTEFYELTAFGSLGEHVVESFGKGTRVVVIGAAEVEHWTDREGKGRTTKRIIANAIGPDLRWATVKVERTGKAGGSTSTGNGSGAPEDKDEPF
jgi:single-strand DNA-binding protein